MAARRTQAPTKPLTGFVMPAAVIGAGYALYLGYPGIAVIWAGLIISAWNYPPAVFTGRKDSRGYPAPAHEGETTAMNRYRFWSDLKFKLVMPSLDWVPRLNPHLSSLAAIWAGVAGYFLPAVDIDISGYVFTHGEWVNAATAYIAVSQFAASRRRHAVADDENPGARIDSLISLARKSPAKVAGLAVGGAAAGGFLATVASVFLPLLTAHLGAAAVPEPIIWMLFLTAGPVAFLAKPWIDEALEHWRLVVEARSEWSIRWEQLKQDPAPRLIDRREVGTAVIDTFDAPGSVGAMAYWAMGPKIGPTLGSGAKFAVTSVPNLDSNNQPVPGTRHPLRFEIIRFPSDQLPDVTDPSTPKEVVYELARCAVVWLAESTGCARPIIDDVHLLTVQPETTGTGKSAPTDAEELVESWKNTAPAAEPEGEEGQASSGSPAAWGITWFRPDGPPADYLRENGLGEFSGAFNAEVLIDHRAMNGAGCMYVGALTDGTAEFDPNTGITSTMMENLAEEDVWNGRWIEIMKMGSNPPVMQAETAKSAQLKNGVTIHSMSFVTRQGMVPSDFWPFEPKLTTVLNAAPFTSMTGFQTAPGERHKQAISVFWSSEEVPKKPDTLAPVRGSDAPKWVLAGLINSAFKVARLAERPEIISASCLSKPESRHHIWKIDLKLYGGVTLAELRGQANKIRQHWGSEWLRIAHRDGVVSIVAGARPTKVKLAEPRHEHYLVKLEWDQVFLDSNISGVGGLLPELKKVDHLPRNEMVSVLDFDLPAGLEFTDFTAARAKMESNSGNSFVEPRRVKNKANAVTLLVCEVNPMPEKADYDWDHIEQSAFIPFATGIDGEPVEYNFRVDAHLLCAGASGGGKSVLLQSLAYGALVRGYELYVADPTKGGADFKFAEPYAKAFTATPFEAAAMMKGVYAEVVRRKNLNSQHSVGNYRDLPEDIRPDHIIILLDEFTSLMGQDPVPPASDDPDMDQEREIILATNRAKTEVGVYAGKIAREARSAGVTLILATQKLAAKMLDTIPGAGDLKVNLSRLLLGKATYGDKQSALRAPQDAPDLGDAIPPGRGLFETTAGAAMAIQAWYNPAEQKILAEKLTKYLVPLDESDKLDLSPFMMRIPGMEAEQQPAAPVETVVELEEMVLSLDDLEITLDDLEEDEPVISEAAVVEEPATVGAELLPAAVLPTVREIPGCAVFLDVDGTIAPIQHGPGMHMLDVPGHGRVAVLPEVIDGLNALPARLVWLDAWEDDASEHLGPFMPRAVEHLPHGSDDTGWWKIDAALEWLRRNPGITRLVWIDDELTEEDDLLGLTFQEIAEEAFTDAGVEALLLAPNPDGGMTAYDLANARAFLGEPDDAPDEEDGLFAAPVLVEDAPVQEPEPDEWGFTGSLMEDAPAPAAGRKPKKLLDDDDPFAEPVTRRPVIHEDIFG